MAVLTWRNVDAPQGGNAGIAGLATAAGLLTNGSNGLSDAIGKFGQAQTDLANNAAVQAASRYQSASDLSSALSNGSLLSGLQGLGVDPSRVDAKTIEALQKGVGDRVNNDLHTAQTTAAVQKGLYDTARAQKSGFDLGVAQQNQAGLDGIRAMQNRINYLRGVGQNDLADQLSTSPDYQAMRASVDPKTLAELDQAGLTAGKSSLDIRDGNFKFNTSVEDRQNLQTANAATANFLQGAPTDDQGMSDRITAAKLPPAVDAMVRDNLNKRGWKVSPGPLGSGAVMGGGAVPAAGAGNASAAMDAFVSQYAPVADQVSKKTGIDANTLLGQWGLETGWGKSVIPGTNNLGNIKSTTADGVAARDNQTGSVDKYQQFATPEDFGNAYADLLNRRYKGAIGTGFDTDATAKGLVAGGYATDPQYASKLIAAASMVNRSRQGAPAPAGSLDAGEQDVTAAGGNQSASDALAKVATQGLPSLAQVRQDANQVEKDNIGLSVGQQGRTSQDIAAAQINPAVWATAGRDQETSNLAVARRLIAPPSKENLQGGALAGENLDDVLKAIERIKNSTAGRLKDKDGNDVTPTAAQAGILLEHGSNLWKSASVPGKILPNSVLPGPHLKSGGSFDSDAADSLLATINGSGMEDAATKVTGNAQAQAAVDSATKAFTDVQKEVATMNAAVEAGRAPDAKDQMRVAEKYYRLQQRLRDAQQRLSGENFQKRGQDVANAQNAQAASNKRESAVRVQQAMDDILDPTKNPLLYTPGI
ncbi:glucosaminidase domain-containing protein [Caballeronia sp. LZ034LL]|uniref:glucosaminidase domain-containing protein n=1 Tax=Caballeronia sp. LZ034LL TaxID=3038567 RepID=UPI002856CE75|nr:glucosaminidase domain-containing protein [Caballeronia sp. LZ034LL]MDR5839314.1 glucosaminidase domain-containing protein [Caballeronia sp. LZ034LL]